MKFPRIYLLLVVIVFSACSDNTVLGFPAEELSRRLEAGDHEFLRHGNYDRSPSRNVDELGGGAAYYLSLVYQRLGMDRIATDLAESEFRSGDALWDQAAGELLVSLHLDDERFDAALSIAEELIRRFPEGTLGGRLYVETLYESGEFEALSSHLQERYGIRPQAEDVDHLDDEVLLWWLVAVLELEESGWEDYVRVFFLDRPAADAHARLELYISYRPSISAAFDDTDRTLFLGKRLLAEGDFDAAYDRLAAYIEENGRLSAAMGADFARAALGAGRLSEGAVRLEGAARGSTGALLSSLLFEAGRMYRWEGTYSQAVRVLDESLETVDMERFERTLWYYLSSLVKTDPFGAVAEFAAFARRITTPGYFADVYEELVGNLAEQRHWESIWLLYQVTEDYVTPGMAAQLQFLLARLMGADLLAVSPERSPELERELLTLAADQQDSTYYRMLATAALDREYALPERTILRDDGVDTSGSSDNPADALGQFVIRHLDFGLYEAAYTLALVSHEELSYSSLIGVGDRLADRGRVAEALRIHARAGRRAQIPVGRDLGERLYPLAFQSLVREAAENHGVPVHVLFGLLREESYFDPEAVSHAGAIGLAQIMPTTAADLAGRMRMNAEPDLTDAATSVSMGAYYLSGLAERFEPFSRALAAYNGGQGRLRRWQQSRGALSDEVFVETIPFPETRGYVRKVLVSAVHYGYLYEKIPVRTTVRGFYPQL